MPDNLLGIGVNVTANVVNGTNTSTTGNQTPEQIIESASPTPTADPTSSAPVDQNIPATIIAQDVINRASPEPINLSSMGPIPTPRNQVPQFVPPPIQPVKPMGEYRTDVEEEILRRTFNPTPIRRWSPSC